MGSGPPVTQVSAQTNLFVPKGQRAGNKRERQEIKDEEEGERKKEADPRVFVPEEQRTDRYRLDREETDMDHKSVVIYKGKRGNLMLE